MTSAPWFRSPRPVAGRHAGRAPGADDSAAARRADTAPGTGTDTDTALAPLRDRLLGDARADARALRAAAERDADAAVRDAEARAERILGEARRLGEADARARQLAAHVAARRAARARELAARRACWDELCRQVVSGVEELRHTAAYPELRERLAARVRGELGPDAVIAEDPGGGVIGEAPGRRVDCRLATFARRALDTAGTEGERLWAP